MNNAAQRNQQRIMQAIRYWESMVLTLSQEPQSERTARQTATAKRWIKRLARRLTAKN